MRLLINAIMLSKNNTGLGMFSYHVLKYLDPILSSNNIDYNIICYDKEYLPDSCKSKALILKDKSKLTRLSSIQNIVKNNKPDLFFSLTQHGVKLKGIKQIITIHDLTPLLFPKNRIHQYFYYKFVLPRIAKYSSKILTVSENTKKDIVKYLKISESNIDVVYDALPELSNNKNVDEKSVLDKYNIKKEKYFSIIGIHYPYKNIEVVIDCFHKYEKELSNFKVVIIGNDKNTYGESLKKKIHKYNLDSKFVFTSYISEEEKKVIINNSISVIFPSLYEGFGLPILEAYNARVPLILSNASSLPEVAKGGAILFNGKDVDELYSSIKKVISISREDRDKLTDEAFKICESYNWQKISEKIFSSIISVVKV